MNVIILEETVMRIRSVAKHVRLPSLRYAIQDPSGKQQIAYGALTRWDHQSFSRPSQWKNGYVSF